MIKNYIVVYYLQKLDHVSKILGGNHIYLMTKKLVIELCDLIIIQNKIKKQIKKEKIA